MSAVVTLVQASPGLGMDAMTALLWALMDEDNRFRYDAVLSIVTLVQASPELGEDAMTHLS